MRNTHTTEQRTDAACETGGGRGSWLSRLRRHATTAKAERAARSERGEIGIGMIIGLGITVGVLTVAGVIIFNVVRDSGDSVESAVGSNVVYYASSGCETTSGQVLGTYRVAVEDNTAADIDDDHVQITIDETERTNVNADGLGFDLTGDGDTNDTTLILVAEVGPGDTPPAVSDGFPSGGEIVSTNFGADDEVVGWANNEAVRLVRGSDSNGRACVTAQKIS